MNQLEGFKEDFGLSVVASHYLHTDSKTFYACIQSEVFTAMLKAWGKLGITLVHSQCSSRRKGNRFFVCVAHHDIHQDVAVRAASDKLQAYFSEHLESDKIQFLSVNKLT